MVTSLNLSLPFAFDRMLMLRSEIFAGKKKEVATAEKTTPATESSQKKSYSSVEERRLYNTLELEKSDENPQAKPHSVRSDDSCRASLAIKTFDKHRILTDDERCVWLRLGPW